VLVVLLNIAFDGVVMSRKDDLGSPFDEPRGTLLMRQRPMAGCHFSRVNSAAFVIDIQQPLAHSTDLGVLGTQDVVCELPQLRSFCALLRNARHAPEHQRAARLHAWNTRRMAASTTASVTKKVGN